MDVRHPMSVWHSFSIKYVFYGKIDVKVVSATFLLVFKNV